MKTKKSTPKTLPHSEVGEETFRLLFHHNPIPMWVYDLNTLAFLEVNDAATEKYGYTRDEFLAMTIREIRPSEDIPRLVENVKSKRPDIQHSGEWRHKLKDGSIIDMEIHSHTTEFNGHKAAMVAANDITERKRAEETLRENQTMFKGLFEASPDAIAVVNSQGLIMQVNSQAENIFGYLRNELVGQQVEMLIPASLRERHTKDRATYLAHPRIRPMGTGINLSGLRKDGTLFPVDIILSPLEIQSGFLTLAVIHDITKRKQAEEEISMLVSAFKSINETVVITDLEHNIRYANPAFLTTYGYSLNELVGKKIEEMRASNNANEIIEDINKAAKTGGWHGE
ncbi:MAG: PAS domain S-box protein, partial [Ignavibacteriales bacterium]|nr:PAS domain S-box protein [Ignavibacteriales bacterium]